MIADMLSFDCLERSVKKALVAIIPKTNRSKLSSATGHGEIENLTAKALDISG